MLSGAAVVPYLAVSFSVYDHLKAQVKEDRTTRQLWWYPLAKIGMGATASTVAQVRVFPPASLHDSCATQCPSMLMSCEDSMPPTAAGSQQFSRSVTRARCFLAFRGSATFKGSKHVLTGHLLCCRLWRTLQTQSEEECR